LLLRQTGLSRVYLPRFALHLALLAALAGARLALGFLTITRAARVIGRVVDGDRHGAFAALAAAGACMAAAAAARALFTLQAELASVTWRRALVTRLHALYTDDRAVLYCGMRSRGIDNPDQRIAKDATGWCGGGCNGLG
jgi:ABC-type uncharacterized transport system fused permease/ATPase subunit